MKEKKLTLVGHLAELRKRLFIAALAFIVTSCCSYTCIQPIVKDILKPASKLNFIYVTPPELLLAYVKISMIAGLTLSAPVIFWEIWAFVKPGLKKDEKKYILFSLFGGAVFFILGIVFAYKVILPFTMQFFTNLHTEEIKPMISFGNYVGFITTILLSFGLVFEMPILMIFLTKFGIINANLLKQNRKYAVLTVFIIAAVITPPDVVSQILLAGPMILLFEFGVILSRMVEKKKTLQN